MSAMIRRTSGTGSGLPEEVPLVRVLIVNPGSSSLKLRVIGPDDELLATSDLSAEGGRFETSDLEGFLAGAGSLDAVGYRVVHGGTLFTGGALIEDAVERAIRSLADLAPLHQFAALQAIGALRPRLESVPHVACFDTAFHATLPASASTYALPKEWRERYGIRRFGFHGLSHSYASRRAAEMLGTSIEEMRIVTCHLGAGASLAAVAGGRSIDTTMGFTPLEGLVMATRSGTIDPVIVTWLQKNTSLKADDIQGALEHGSGLLGLAGTADMREVIERSGTDEEARTALEVYIRSLAAGVAAMTSSLGGLDALVFTGGVGEKSSVVRTLAGERLAFLGVGVDRARNGAPDGDRDISDDDATVRTLVVESREDLEIAHEVRKLLS
jgi:acetate kinase